MTTSEITRELQKQKTFFEVGKEKGFKLNE